MKTVLVAGLVSENYVMEVVDVHGFAIAVYFVQIAAMSGKVKCSYGVHKLKTVAGKSSITFPSILLLFLLLNVKLFLATGFYFGML